MSYSLTRVSHEEIPVLLEMIRELATFEKLAHTVEATPASLEEAFFGPGAIAGALLARKEGVPAGYAIYFFTFSSFVGRRGIWLEDVYVRPAFRQQGLGLALIRAIARIGVEHRCGRFEWTALNWNRTALDLYERLGARVRGEWVLLRLEAEGIRRLAEASTTEE